MKISNPLKKIFSGFLVIILLIFILIGGAIIEKFNLFPITSQLSLFLEKAGLSGLRSAVKDSVTGIDQIEEIYISSNYYELILKKYERPTYDDYGGIDFLNDELFYVDKSGYGWILNKDEFKKIITDPLELKEESFIKTFGSSAGYSYGVKDLLVVNNGSVNRIFLSTTNFDTKNKCYYLSIFVTNIDNDFSQIGGWTSIFNSEPCLKMHKNNTYAGTSAGGRLGYKNNFLYFSLGDFYFDGVNEKDIVSLEGSNYGKIIKISLEDMKVENFATGLRNPQGMFIDKDGIFETEHAPQGGDELNFIGFDQTKKDYGWPNATYGVDYEKKIWPLDPTNRNHRDNDSVEPIMSWIPSIGISNVIRFYSKKELSRWNEDLLVSSLRDKSIYRIKLSDKRPMLIEKIELGFRIRDLIQNGEKIYIQEAGSKYVWELQENN